MGSPGTLSLFQAFCFEVRALKIPSVTFPFIIYTSLPGFAFFQSSRLSFSLSFFLSPLTRCLFLSIKFNFLLDISCIPSCVILSVGFVDLTFYVLKESLTIPYFYYPFARAIFQSMSLTRRFLNASVCPLNIKHHRGGIELKEEDRGFPGDPCQGISESR